MSKGKMKLKESYLKRKEQQKGITLIALVITIVILIILATITINFVFGENGLINKANQAKDMYIKGDERETITLAIATIEAELKPVERDNLQTKIEDLRGAESVEVTPFAGALQVKFKKTGNIYLVGTNGEIIDNNEEINLSLNAIYDMSTGEGKVLYFMPIFQYEGQDIMNPQSISEEEMRNISLELMKSISKMSQAEKETWLLWFCNAMVYMSDNPPEGVELPIETMDELFKALNIENLDQLLESEGFSDISELILDEMDLVLIQLPDGSYEATTPYMPIGYPISQSGTYTFKVRCGGLYKEVAINVEDNHRTVFGKWKDAVITGEHMSECLLAQNEDNNIYVWTGGELSWLPPEQIIEMNEEVTILEGGVMLSKDGKRIYYLVKEDSNFELKTIEVPEGITIIDIANDYALDNNGDIWNIGTYNGTMEKEDFDYKFEKIYNNIFITKEGKIISYQGEELQGINVNSVKSISNTMLLTNEGEIYYLGRGGNLTRSMAAYEWIKKELPFKVIDIAGTMLISEDNKLYNLSDPDDIGSLTEIQLDHKPIKFIGEEETDFYRSLVNGYSIEDENGNYAEIPGDMVSDSYAWKYFEKNGNYKKVTSGRHSLALIDENNNLIIAGKLCRYPV